MPSHAFHCPIDPAINPHHERARADSLAWLVQHRLLRDEAALARFDRIGIAEFVARAYPYASYEDLRVVLDWTLWGFLADDQHDELVRRPELLRARYLEHGEVLERGLSDHITGMHAALANVRDRVVERSHPGCLRRFAEAAREWFASMHVETENRVRATPPSIAGYLRLREVTVGMYTEYALFDVTHRVRTDDAFWIEPDVRRLMTMAANIIGWANDVFSFVKEREAGDPHNLVLLFGAEMGLAERDAVERSITMHDREMIRFLELEQGVRTRGWIDPKLSEPFLELLRSWIRGNLDWALASERYRQPAATRERTRARAPKLVAPSAA
ncbi:MAG TPA: hypothetical protein VG755_32265 [Nannocystaceae bacterium]|nr:hypothetical protein [Nannocystaceae bacterium]